MSLRQLTLGDLRDPIARVLGSCATDSRIPTLVNEAQERLLDEGNWLGSIQRVRICTTSSCITWPRQVSSILAWSLCGVPGSVMDRWYEFLPNGPGLRTECCGNPNRLLARDPSPLFDDLWDATSNVGLECSLPEAVGAVATIQGYDGNGQWIQTLVGGSYIDGFQLPLSQTLQISPMTVSKISRIRLPVRNGFARLWQVRSSAYIKPLGFYEPDETTPWYRRSFVPGLSELAQSTTNLPTAGCGCSGAAAPSTAGCCCRQVDVIAKLRHLPVSRDADWLILCNPSALKLAVMAILKEERNLPQESSVCLAEAVRLLEKEKANHDGDAQAILNVASTSLFGAGAVENDIAYPWTTQ